jgi:hypothetical protein
MDGFRGFVADGPHWGMGLNDFRGWPFIGPDMPPGCPTGVRSWTVRIGLQSPTIPVASAHHPQSTNQTEGHVTMSHHRSHRFAGVKRPPGGEIRRTHHFCCS